MHERTQTHDSNEVAVKKKKKKIHNVKDEINKGGAAFKVGALQTIPDQTKKLQTEKLWRLNCRLAF